MMKENPHLFDRDEEDLDFSFDEDENPHGF